MGSSGDPRSSGTSQTTFLAWTYANGGDARIAPGIEYAKQIVQQYNAAEASTDLLEKGEIVLWMRYDFNCKRRSRMKEKGINAQTVIPGVSIYAPSAVMANRYNTAKKDAVKLFMEYVLSDEAAADLRQVRRPPIRYVLGQQELPEEATAGWLPEEDYKDVVVVEDFTSIDANESPRPGTKRSWVASSEGISLGPGGPWPRPGPPRSAIEDVSGGLAAGCPRCPCWSSPRPCWWCRRSL